MAILAGDHDKQERKFTFAISSADELLVLIACHCALCCFIVFQLILYFAPLAN